MPAFFLTSLLAPLDQMCYRFGYNGTLRPAFAFERPGFSFAICGKKGWRKYGLKKRGDFPVLGKQIPCSSAENSLFGQKQFPDNSLFLKPLGCVALRKISGSQ
jgi:hypothetical protein